MEYVVVALALCAFGYFVYAKVKAAKKRKDEYVPGGGGGGSGGDQVEK